jgi:hypothetical protein
MCGDEIVLVKNATPNNAELAAILVIRIFLLVKQIISFNVSYVTKREWNKLIYQVNKFLGFYVGHSQV